MFPPPGLRTAAFGHLHHPCSWVSNHHLKLRIFPQASPSVLFFIFINGSSTFSVTQAIGLSRPWTPLAHPWCPVHQQNIIQNVPSSPCPETPTLGQAATISCCFIATAVDWSFWSALAPLQSSLQTEVRNSLLQNVQRILILFRVKTMRLRWSVMLLCYSLITS